MKPNVLLIVFAVALVASVVGLAVSFQSNGAKGADNEVARIRAIDRIMDLGGQTLSDLQEALITQNLGGSIAGSSNEISPELLQKILTAAADAGREAATEAGGSKGMPAADVSALAEVVKQNGNLVSALSDMRERYLKALEDRLNAPSFDWSLLASTVAMLASLSGIIIAWRKDHREARALRVEAPPGAG